MKKMFLKLAAACLSLVLAVTVTSVATYAWMTLSGSPAVQGIQIAIAGGNTILLAADLTGKEDGVISHYPGAFSDTLNFSQYESYDYLSELGGLTPVSTADGVCWVYQAGEAYETDLAHANLTAEDPDSIEKGSYVYLDFWVVAPAADYELHVSTDGNGLGSFLIGLMEPEAVDTNADGADDAYRLGEAANSTAASVRVGFLANTERTGDSDLYAYLGSADYNSQYISLRGVYDETPDTAGAQTQRFTIYEPNGTLHTAEGVENGSYVLTRPLTMTSSGIMPEEIKDRLCVQETSRWLPTADGSQTILEQMFQASIAGKEFRSLTPEGLMESFYHQYLQGQVAPYVSAGNFFKSTTNLYALAAGGDTVSAQTITEESEGGKFTAGATDDVYIVKLEKNVPQRIRMFIWLEGQDVDCTTDTGATSFALSLELAGGTEGK